jgi:hypothetical protein
VAALAAALLCSAGCAGEPSAAEQRANEARARAATDCLSFTKQVLRDLAADDGADLLRPGVAPSIPIHGYWFGPHLDKRRAILASASIQKDWDEDKKQEVPIPGYAVSYQLPEDGCLNGRLVVSADEFFGYHAGHELDVVSMPADAPTARLYLHDPEVLGPAEPIHARLANGEEVTAYPGSLLGFTVLTESTLIFVNERYGSAEETKRLLPLLRPVGK